MWAAKTLKYKNLKPRPGRLAMGRLWVPEGALRPDAGGFEDSPRDRLEPGYLFASRAASTAREPLSMFFTA